MFSVTNYSGFATPASARILVPPGPALAWYDFADATMMTTSGSAITAMTDKTGNGYNLTGTGTVLYLGSSQNGRSVGGFGGTGGATGYLRRVLGTFIIPDGTAPFSIVCVARYLKSSISGAYLFYQNNNGPQAFIQNISGTDTADFTVGIGNNGPYAETNGFLIPDNWRIYSAMINHGTQTARLDGGVFSGTGFGGGTNTASTTDIQIGGFGGPSWPGYIAEQRLFNSFIGTASLFAEEGYAAWRWGLQGNLPSDHPYKSAPP